MSHLRLSGGHWALVDSPYNRGDSHSQSVSDAGPHIVRTLKIASRKVSTFDVKESNGTGKYRTRYQRTSIDAQVKCLNALIPGIGTANVSLTRKRLPADCEGYFAIPRWQAIAATYNIAVARMLNLHRRQQNRALNAFDSQTGPSFLKQHNHSTMMWKIIGEQQSGFNILIVQGQFGGQYIGRSVRQVQEAFPPGYFGLGAFAVGIMLLTHPDRLECSSDLWISCPGDDYARRNRWEFDAAPYFRLGAMGVTFGAYDAVGKSAGYGSATAHNPQAPI